MLIGGDDISGDQERIKGTEKASFIHTLFVTSYF